MPDRDALGALITAIETELRDGYCFNRMDQARRALHNIRSAAREARAAVRRLAEQGEAHVVAFAGNTESRPYPHLVLTRLPEWGPSSFKFGTRVLVRRAEEGT